MEWRIGLYIAMLAIAAGGISFFYMGKKRKRSIRYLGAGVFIACVAVCFPVKHLDESAGYAMVMSISHSIRMFVVDTGMEDIIGMLSEEMLGHYYTIYKIFVCALYVCAPLFTLSVVLSYFSNFFERLRLKLKWRHNLYIFSELNSHSICVAADIWERCRKEEKAAIVFCKSNQKDNLNSELEEKARMIRAIFTTSEMEDLHLNDLHRRISYFQIDEDEEKNLENTIQMIESGKGNVKKHGVYIYCFTTKAEAEILIDAKEKGDLKVIVVDEAREAVYEQIFKYPIFSAINPMEYTEEKSRIKLVIFGGGKIGIEFLKAAVWGGQMSRFESEIHLIDTGAEEVRSQLKQECPELIGTSGENGAYPIHIHQADVFGCEIEEILDRIGSINYCVSSLKSDEDNIRAAVFLRKYYGRKNLGNWPVICAHIQSLEKRKAVWELYEPVRKRGKRMYYNIIPFGGTFENRTEAAFMEEYLALGVHFHYYRINRNSTEEERRNAVRGYYERQGNRRSSMANGIHMKYKLWELGLGIIRVPEEEEMRREFLECVEEIDFVKETDGKLGLYFELEHERWMAFTRTEGWTMASFGGKTLSDIRSCYQSYCAQFKNQNPILKFHPALVKTHPEDSREASLESVENMMKQANDAGEYGSYDPQYVASDMEVVKNIGKIVSGEWCGEKGILINGKLEKEGNYRIGRLEDIGYYYLKIYTRFCENKDTEDVLFLRNMIKYSYYSVICQKNKTHETLAEAYLALAYIAKEEMLMQNMKIYQGLAEKEKEQSKGEIRLVIGE